MKACSETSLSMKNYHVQKKNSHKMKLDNLDSLPIFRRNSRLFRPKSLNGPKSFSETYLSSLFSTLYPLKLKSFTDVSFSSLDLVDYSWRRMMSCSFLKRDTFRLFHAVSEESFSKINPIFHERNSQGWELHLNLCENTFDPIKFKKTLFKI